MAIPVDSLHQVTDARCTSCLTCVEACPKRADGALSWGPPKPIPGAWSQAALIAVMVLCTSGAVAASYAFPMPSFVKTHGTAPEETASVTLEIYDLTCRGRANLLVYYLERDDDRALSGFLKFEAWPGPGAARARVSFDPAATDMGAILEAISEPYYDYDTGQWRMSPFRIAGYDPLRRRYGAR